MEGTDRRFRKPEEYQWPDTVKLTGHEGPRDLEILYHLATVGELDDVVSRHKFGKGCRVAINTLIRMGHPIRMERQAKWPNPWRYQWIPRL